jgi:cell division protein FtsL
MIGRSTLLWAALAVTAGMGLFQVSYRVQTLEQELTRTNRQIIGERETIHVLTAEWSYLNEPRRLAELTRRHLELAPLSATQMTRIEDLPLRLPPLMAAAPVPETQIAPGKEPAAKEVTKKKEAARQPAKPDVERGAPTSITDLINRVSDQQ